MGDNYTGPERRTYTRTAKPPCPQCRSDASAVVDSDVDNLPVPPEVFSRERRCKQCGHRWYTIEHNLDDTTICGFRRDNSSVYPK